MELKTYSTRNNRCQQTRRIDDRGHLIMQSTVPVIILHMLQSGRLWRIKSITFPTIMMFGALYVMLLSPRETCKVEATVVAGPVVAGLSFVLVEGSVVSEPSVTAIAIGHQMVVVRRKEWIWVGTQYMTRHGVSNVDKA